MLGGFNVYHGRIIIIDSSAGVYAQVALSFEKSGLSAQLCIVHMVRNLLKFISWKQHKEVAADLNTIYWAATAEQAEINLPEFEERWDKTHPAISQC